MNPGKFIITIIARALKIPTLAMDMFSASNRASGLSTRTLPTELIPMNSIQFSRGLLNFTLLQCLRDWVLPFWAERQYDPLSASFVPRSHLGLSINVTHRNWTAVGSPDCPIEPIVDPRGLVTPFRDGWSIDVWFMIDGVTFFPSQSWSCQQELVDHLPIVKTIHEYGAFRFELFTFTSKDLLQHRVEISNLDDAVHECMAGFALRPFNPEGISLVHTLRYDLQKNCFIINDKEKLALLLQPDIIHCSDFLKGDCARLLPSLPKPVPSTMVTCANGMANAFAGFLLSVAAGATQSIQCTIPLQSSGAECAPISSISSVQDEWNGLLSRGLKISTPDDRINALLKASIASVLLLHDGKEITAGPLTYHQFWFRDAAFMLNALDKFGHHSFSRSVIYSFPSRQDPSGFFRSQQGEWDSNGQALWTVQQHMLYHNDLQFLAELFPSLVKGTEWIGRTRLTAARYNSQPYFGLMPAGLSSEHLGLADHYFWDNVWSIAGIESFIWICSKLGKEKEKAAAEALRSAYTADLEAAIARVQQKYQISEIPATPTRGLDCGMIGSCCFWYPLQALPAHDERMAATMATLMNRFTVRGLFFQDFVHSGMNPYLTLQMAQAWLYAGERTRFWILLNNVISHASSTLNYPEAIHPQTGGGAMGDGHHGWVSAEILHAFHDAFILVRKNRSMEPELTLLAGIPASWFEKGKSFAIRNAPVPHGLLSCEISTESTETIISLHGEMEAGRPSLIMTFHLPFIFKELYIDGKRQAFKADNRGESSFILRSGSAYIKIIPEMNREVQEKRST